MSEAPLWHTQLPDLSVLDHERIRKVQGAVSRVSPKVSWIGEVCIHLGAAFCMMLLRVEMVEELGQY